MDTVGAAGVAAALISAGVITQVVEAIKRLGLPSRFAPLLAMIVGLVLGVVAAWMTATPLIVGAAAGLLAGVLASKAYDAGRESPRASNVTITTDVTGTAAQLDQAAAEIRDGLLGKRQNL